MLLSYDSSYLTFVTMAILFFSSLFLACFAYSNQPFRAYKQTNQHHCDLINSSINIICRQKQVLKHCGTNNILEYLARFGIINKPFEYFCVVENI